MHLTALRPPGNAAGGLRHLALCAARAAYARVTDKSPRRGAPTIIAAASLDELTRVLARDGFSPGWPLGTVHAGADVHLIRFWYSSDYTHPYRQTHVRLWDAPDEEGVAIEARATPNVLVHPRAYRREPADRDLGTQLTELTLDDAGTHVWPA